MYRGLRLTGTGKSTLVKFIISALNLDDKDVCYVAYTGKAAKVLKDKGCANAMTAHRLLYKSFPNGDGTFRKVIKRPLEHPYKLIVVDEISMLPKNMWDLLLSHCIHVLCLGDPFQLPAVSGEDNRVLEHPHIFLDEIMRQAQKSEIIRLSMNIRAEKPVLLFKGKEVQVIHRKNVIPEMYDWADQVIVAKNASRRIINSGMRKRLLNVENNIPVAGDKVICLENDWDNISEAGDVMVNGSIGFLNNVRLNNRHPYLHPEMIADFLPEDYTDDEVEQCPQDLYFRKINMDYKLLTTGEETVTKQNFKRFPKRFRPMIFDYGYCITCWKAQGSEYNKVLGFEENFPAKGTQEHARYLYTMVTRAKERLVLVKN